MKRNIRVKPQPGEDLRTVLKRFKKICDREGISKELKKHTYYEKPSEVRRRKIRKSERQAEFPPKSKPERKQDFPGF